MRTIRITQAEYDELTGRKSVGLKRARISPLCFNSHPTGWREQDGRLIFIYPLPPTKNSEPRNVYERSKMKHHWQRLTCDLWLESGQRRFKKIAIMPVFYCKRARDADNCLGLAWKGLQDGFSGRMIQDDKPEFLELRKVVLNSAKGTTERLEVWIEGLCGYGGE